MEKKYKSSIVDFLVLESQLHPDERGYFMENWRKDDLIRFGVPTSFFKGSLQNNVSISKKGVIRGMHCQGWSKLMTVAYGQFRMCFVDLRPASATFKEIEVLDVSPGTAIYVPAGIANGAQALTDNAILNYLVTDYYNPYEKYLGIMPMDSDLNLPWEKELKVIISDKDFASPSYQEVLEDILRREK